MRLRDVLPAVALGAVVAIGATPNVAADDHRTECQKKVEKAQDHFRHEVHEHGKHSRQAENARAKLNAEWDRCWTLAHGWYDPHRHEWRTDRDWDRNYDWDHDRDDR
jgi:hypothetical protein